MKNEELNDEKKIPYQFTANPLNLMYILDSDCLKMLNLLIQEESYWRSQGQLVDGYFFKSINDLKEDMFMTNDKDVRLTIEALYASGLIDVINQGKLHKANKFKINLEKVMEYNSRTITDVKKFCPRICKLKRNSVCSYMKLKENNPKQDVKVDTKFNTDCSPVCTPKLDNSDSLNKSDLLNNSYYLNNKDCLNNKENDIINNNIIDNKNFKNESVNTLNNMIEDNEINTVDTNYQQISDASIPMVDAHTIDLSEFEERFSNYLSDCSENKGLFDRIVEINKHYEPEDYLNIERIVKRKEFKYNYMQDLIMMYLPK